MSKKSSLGQADYSSPNTLQFPAVRHDESGRVEQLVRSEVLDSMEQGIIVWSEAGICEMVNARYYRLNNQGIDYLHVGMTRKQYFDGMVERGDASAEMIQDLEARLQARQPFSIERQVASGAYVAVYIRPMSSGGHVVTYTDITETRNSQKILSEATARAEHAEQEARQALEKEQARQAETRSLSELSDWLQSCKSIDELYEIVRQAMASMFKHSDGQLFIYSNSRDVLDGAVTWGNAELIRSIQPQDCWSLRRGRRFQYGDGVVKYPCNHVPREDGSYDGQYLCLPIVAQGDTVGMLHIAFAGEADREVILNERIAAFAQRCAEQISMAIANVKLRDELHEQSTRDPLTGLFNRRYFLERCRSAISMVERDSGSLALIAFDADNFKSYNDNFGHDAGDYLLCALGELTRRYFDGEQVCCRIGGEEFSVLLPDADAASAMQQAQEFLQIIEAHEFRYRDQLLPTVTVSAGVAVYPLHARNLQDLSKSADIAMYDAKDCGKNVVVLANEQ